jgi:hypothetical protein
MQDRSDSSARSARTVLAVVVASASFMSGVASALLAAAFTKLVFDRIVLATVGLAALTIIFVFVCVWGLGENNNDERERVRAGHRQS